VQDISDLKKKAAQYGLKEKQRNERENLGSAFAWKELIIYPSTLSIQPVDAIHLVPYLVVLRISGLFTP